MRNSIIKILIVIPLCILITGTLNVTNQIFIKDKHSTVFCCCSGKVEEECTCSGNCCSQVPPHFGQQLSKASCGQPLQLESISIDFKFLFDQFDYSSKYPTNFKYKTEILPQYYSYSLPPDEKPPELFIVS